MEHFYTLQGEAAFAGNAAYFIRLGGCDVGCVWCDVKDSWDAAAHPKMTLDAIIKAANNYPSKIAVVTGGEPTMYPLAPLTDALHNAGFRTHIETSGTNKMTGEWDWITLSPKKFKAPLPDSIALADELKIIVFHKSDFAWAEKYAAQVKPECKLYLQTEWDKRDEMTPLIIEYIMQNPKWQLSLQTHKYLNIP